MQCDIACEKKDIASVKNPDEHESDQIQQELLAIVTGINVAAVLDKFPVTVHKDRDSTGGLHVLTNDTL